MSPNNRYILYLLLYFFLGSVEAQTGLLENISIEQGLSQGFVPAMMQDKDGFMWFGTANGLNRYDGYEFLAFKNDPYDPHSISENLVLSITEAGDFFGILTANREICLFHPGKRIFYRIPKATPLLKDGPSQLYSAGDNAIWFFAHDRQKQNLFRLSWQPDLLKSLPRDGDPESLIRIDTLLYQTEITAISRSFAQKKMWILAPDRILVRDLDTGKAMQEITLPPALHDCQRFAADSSGCWLLSKDKLAHFDGQNWQVTPLEITVNRLLEMDLLNGLLWLCAGQNVYAFDLRRIPAVIRPSAAMHHLVIPEIAICALTDDYGNVWFGTDAKGIRKFNPQSSAFKNYLQGYSIYAAPLDDGQGRIWLGDVRRGQPFSGAFDLKSGRLQTLQELGLSQQWILNRIVQDDDGNFWIGALDEAENDTYLSCYRPGSGKLEVFHVPPGFSHVVFAMRYESTGQMWLANDNQLLRFDIQSRQFVLFESAKRQKEFRGAFALEKTPDGTWWIATENGLLKAEPDGGDPAAATRFNFTLFQNDVSDRNSLPGNQIKSILADPADPKVLWVGTANRGLTRLDLRTNTFKHFNTQNGLPDDTVYGILADNAVSPLPKGGDYNLWLSTNRGLTRFNPASGQFQYYFKADGLQDNEFNTYSYAKSATGELMFGGVNGLTVFDPRQLNSNKKPPRVQITGLEINGLGADPGNSGGLLDMGIERTRSIRLPYSKNNLNIRFAATDYSRIERNRFAFYLEGAEEPWIHTGFEHTAQYLNLAPGNYTFWVKATNSDGIWCEQPVRLNIEILPPWYRSGWAYLMYFLIGVTAFYALYRVQLNRKMDQMEARRLKELDAFKSRFFTNISHEFRTPLTVILGITQQLMSKPAQVKERLPLIQRNGENLLRLVNQILDLAKLESDSLKMNYVQGDVLAFLRYVVESLHSMANAQNVLLEVNSPSASIVMDHDPEHLMQIVHNLLSNAIKFTPSGGRIRLHAEISNQKFYLTVRDTGVGIAAEDQPKLFNRFFQANNQDQARSGGTGIGLSLTFELVKAMNGDISFESLPGEGSTFTVILPVTNQAPFQESPVPAKSGFQAERDTIVSGSGTRLSSATDTDSPLLLLVEDNPDVLEYLRDCLQSHYRLEYAYNGRAGIEKALEIIPDLIVSDVMMPEKDGFEVCETLKSDERSSHIPIVLLTARASVKDRIAGLRRGADAYLSKPFHPEELLVTLSKLIELRQKLRLRYASLEAPDITGSRETEMEDAFLLKIRRVVEDHLSDAGLGVDQLCRLLGMSHSVIHRKLTALTGRSLTLYVRLIRLQKSRELLQNREYSISEVAYATGFNDPKFFSRVFAEEYGKSPSAFRES